MRLYLISEGSRLDDTEKTEESVTLIQPLDKRYDLTVPVIFGMKPLNSVPSG